MGEEMGDEMGEEMGVFLERGGFIRACLCCLRESERSGGGGGRLDFRREILRAMERPEDHGGSPLQLSPETDLNSWVKPLWMLELGDK